MVLLALCVHCAHPPQNSHTRTALAAHSPPPPLQRIFQVEYAYKAIEAAGTALGVKCSDGVILGVEKLVLSKMLVEGSGRRVHALEEHIGAATAGNNPDGRMLVERGRDEARGYRQNFGEPVPPRVLSDRMGAFMHLFTLYGSYRPVGSGILMAGYDAESKQYELHAAEPTGLALVRARLAPPTYTACSRHAASPPRTPLRSRAHLPPPPPCAIAALLWHGDWQGRPGGKDGNRKAQVHGQDVR